MNFFLAGILTTLTAELLIGGLLVIGRLGAKQPEVHFMLLPLFVISFMLAVTTFWLFGVI